MRNYKTEGIIIRRTNSGEADRLLTILTPYYGKVRVIAKGSRKITSRRAPSLELFNHASFIIYKGKTAEYLGEVKALHAFEHMRKDLQTIQYAYQMSELITILTREGQELDDIYDLLFVSLHRLNDGMQFSLNEFKYKLLLLLGFLSHGTEGESNLDAYIEGIAQRKLYARGIYE